MTSNSPSSRLTVHRVVLKGFLRDGGLGFSPSGRLRWLTACFSAISPRTGSGPPRHFRKTANGSGEAPRTGPSVPAAAVSSMTPGPNPYQGGTRASRRSKRTDGPAIMKGLTHKAGALAAGAASSATVALDPLSAAVPDYDRLVDDGPSHRSITQSSRTLAGLDQLR